MTLDRDKLEDPFYALAEMLTEYEPDGGDAWLISKKDFNAYIDGQMQALQAHTNKERAEARQRGWDAAGGESIGEAWERGRRVGIRAFELSSDSEYFATRESIIETLCGVLWMKSWAEAKGNERCFEHIMSFMRHFDQYVDKRIEDSYKPVTNKDGARPSAPRPV